MNRFKRARVSRAGFSLIELVMSVGIGGLVFLIAIPFALYGTLHFAGLVQHLEMNQEDMLALQEMTQEIRQSHGVTDYETNLLTLKTDPGTSSIKYTYLPSAGQLIRQRGMDTRVLLSGLDYCNFAIFRRTTIAGGYEQHPATSPSEAKVVVMSWQSSRELVGARGITSQRQRAKTVIRKQ